MPDYVGRVIEFYTSGGPRLALVIAESKSRLQITDQNGRQHSIAPKQIRNLFPDEVSTGAFPAELQNLDARLANLQEEVDTELLWESIELYGQPLDLKPLVRVYFGEVDAYHESALFRAVLLDKVRFKVRGNLVVARPHQQVQERLHAESRRREKEESRRRSIAWALRALSDDSVETPDHDTETLLRQTEDFLVNRRDSHIQSWLNEIAGHFPERDLEARETACKLLIAAGKLPEDANPFLIEAGIEQRFPDEVISEADTLPVYTPSGKIRRSCGENVLSIDDADTVEIDDGLSIEETADGFNVGIHIADVSYFVHRDSALDGEAFRRTASIYLPHCSVRMLPDRLSCDLASLRQGETRPTVSFLVQFDARGELLDWSLHRGFSCVSQRLTYEEADRMLAVKPEDETACSLSLLSFIAKNLRLRRQEQGAVTVPRPELKITAKNQRITVKIIDPLSPSRQLVSEMMILANHLIASYAVAQQVPLIFRTQAAPGEAIPPIESYDPYRAHLVFSLLEPGKLSLSPDSHFALGLDNYTQTTSPIRRFTDLVLQRQIVSHLSGDPLPYSSEELIEVLGTVQSVEAQIRSVERRANRLFTLRYLSQRANGDTDAVVIKRIMGGFLVETKDLFVRGRLSASGDLEPGQVVKVKIKKLDPERNLLVFTQ